MKLDEAAQILGQGNMYFKYELRKLKEILETIANDADRMKEAADTVRLSLPD